MGPLWRLLKLSVAMFAVLGVFYVPLGDFTAYERCRRVVAAKSGSTVGAELSDALGGLAARLWSLPVRTSQGAAASGSAASASGAAHGTAAHVTPTRSHAPRSR